MVSMSQENYLSYFKNVKAGGLSTPKHQEDKLSIYLLYYSLVEIIYYKAFISPLCFPNQEYLPLDDNKVSSR